MMVQVWSFLRVWGVPSAALALLLTGCPKAEKPAKQDKQPAVRKARPQAESPATRNPVAAAPRFARGAKNAAGDEVSISDIAEQVVESVVNVRSMKVLRRRTPHYPFFRPWRGPSRRQAQSLGSGVVVSSEGIVLTNHHVVEQASDIRLTFANEEEFEAELVGSDPKSDVAVLRIKDASRKFRPVSLGDSKKLRLGEVVLAVGNPFGVGQTVTMGIVSAVGRARLGIVDYEDFIQTDAAINPGNSGGALINMRGELVGINTAILSRTGGYQGIGFAIPSNMARPIMESLLAHGKVVRGWLGVAIQDLNKEIAGAIGLPVDRGVLVADVQANSPAQRAGLERQDVIVAIDGNPVRSTARLRNRVASAGAGKAVRLTLWRGTEKKELQVVLGELPSDRVAKLEATQGTLGGLAVETLTDPWRARAKLPGGIQGVVVTAVEPGSAAQAAGLRRGDIISEINRRPVRDAGQFTQAYRKASGKKLLLLVYRDGGAMYLLLDK
jgi:serine protease Do